jgi:hypothetical protein
MEFQLAITYLKDQAKKVSLNEIMKLDLLEELLSKDKLSKYLALKQKVQHKSKAHVRKFKYLYPEFLNDKISAIDLEVYFQNFEPEQNIKYFRDYFDTTKESENYTSKGSTIELKAYGESIKINREVISFVGNFRDNILQSFTDKTSESANFVANKFSEIDFYENNLALINTLIKHKALEVLSPLVLFNIALKEAETFEVLYESKQLYFLNQEQLNAIAKKHDSVFRFLIYKNDLDIITKDTIIEIVDAQPKSIQSKFTKLKKAVSEKAFIYDPQNIFYFKSYDIDSSFTKGLKPVKFENDFTSHYSLNDIINDLKIDLDNNSFYKESRGWSSKEIDVLKKSYQSSLYSKVDTQVSEIQKIAADRIEHAKKANNKNKTLGCITFIVIIVIVVALFKMMS